MAGLRQAQQGRHRQGAGVRRVSGHAHGRCAPLAVLIGVEHLEKVAGRIGVRQRDLGDVIEWHLPLLCSKPQPFFRSSPPVRLIKLGWLLAAKRFCRVARMGVTIRHPENIGMAAELLERN